MSKAEKKALKKEIKDMQKNPLKYKQLKDGIDEKQKHLTDLDKEISELTDAISSNQEKINEKDKKIKELGDEIARMETAKREINTAEKNSTNIEGLVYKVQVEVDETALYQEISEIDGQKRPVFTGEEDEDGSKKYTLGYFRSQSEAETFKNYLHTLRIKDAKVVAYKDGKKVE